MRQQLQSAAAAEYADIEQAVVRHGILQNTQSESVAWHISNEYEAFFVEHGFSVRQNPQAREAMRPERPPYWKEVVQMCDMPLPPLRQVPHDVRVEADPDDNKKDPLPDKSNVDLADVRIQQRTDESNRRCVDLELLRYEVLGSGWQDCEGDSPAQQALRHLSDRAIAADRNHGGGGGQPSGNSRRVSRSGRSVDASLMPRRRKAFQSLLEGHCRSSTARRWIHNEMILTCHSGLPQDGGRTLILGFV